MEEEKPMGLIRKYINKRKTIGKIKMKCRENQCPRVPEWSLLLPTLDSQVRKAGSLSVSKGIPGTELYSQAKTAITQNRELLP